MLEKILNGRYVTTSKDPILEDYEFSDYGRKFGWWVLVNGMRVASLDYRCHLERAIHLYSVTPLTKDFYLIDLDPEKWMDSAVTLQSKYAHEYGQQGLGMAAVGNNMIVVEKLCIPEKQFRSQYEKISKIQNDLLAKAEQNEKNNPELETPSSSPTEPSSEV